jgi:hypothetical protein
MFALYPVAKNFGSESTQPPLRTEAPKRHAKEAIHHAYQSEPPQLLQLRLRPLVQQIVHFPSWPVGVQTWRRSFTIPCPLLLQFRRKVVFQHLDNVLAQYREELVAVEGTACSNVKTLCAGVW